MRCWPALGRSLSAAVLGVVQSRHRAGWCRQALTPACPLQSGFLGGGLIDGPPAAGGWLLRLLLPLGGTTLLLSARCAANCAAPSQMRRPALPGSICGEDVPPKRRRICDGPPKRPGGVGQRWPRRAINSFQNLPEKQKRSRCESAFGFPLLSCRGYAA